MARRSKMTPSPGRPIVTPTRPHPHDIPFHEDYPFGRGGVYEIPGDELTFGKDPGRISSFKEPKRGLRGGS